MYYRMTSDNYAPTLGDLERNRVQVFNDWWNTYVPEHKAELERKILHAYHFNQIGAETPERFIYYLNSKLEQIMPYYNQLYASELIKINPMLNYYMQTNGRTIENILSHVNTTDDKFSKAFRDFIAKADGSATTDSSGQSNVTNVSEGNIAATGTRDGTDNENKHTSTSDKLGQTTDTTNNRNETINKTEAESLDDTTDRTLDRTVTETPKSATTTKTMEWGGTETGTETATGKDTTTGSGTKNWTETLDDDSTTKVTGTLSETTDGFSETDYADTPQINLSRGTSRANEGDVPWEGKASIDLNYLTNATVVNDSKKHNSNTTNDTTFADDSTKTHKEDSTDNSTVDKTNNINRTNTKGGKDTETTVLSGSTDTVTDESEHTDYNRSRNLQDDTTDTETSTGNEKLSSDRAVDTFETDDRKTHVSEQQNKTSKDNATSDTTKQEHAQAINTSNNRERSDSGQTSVNQTNKAETTTNDTGKTEYTQGYMNVSASSLLQAFRDTFINVDLQIIEELRDCFMLVY